MRIQNASLSDRLPQTPNLSMNGQGEKKDTDKKQVTFGKAATWQMSELAKKLKDAAEWERGKGPKEKALDAVQALDRERSEKKDAADKLEKQLEDFTLSEKDKKNMREEINKLREDAKSPKDKAEEAIRALEEKVSAVKEQQKDALPEEQRFLAEKMRTYQEEIGELGKKVNFDKKRIYNLIKDASEEEAERLANKIHEDALPGKKKEEGGGPSFETVMEQQQLLLKNKKEEEEKAKNFVNDVLGQQGKEDEAKVEDGMDGSAGAEEETEGKDQNKGEANR